jgi:hypothetical protein
MPHAPSPFCFSLFSNFYSLFPIPYSLLKAAATLIRGERRMQAWLLAKIKSVQRFSLHHLKR